ncbi:MAG TPA: peptidylprolyl isomerase, partial [Thermomicrobiales bacterium]|nr:peptidylprolyl isomerase [Thermomicrobiales bacterium]
MQRRLLAAALAVAMLTGCGAQPAAQIAAPTTVAATATPAAANAFVDACWKPSERTTAQVEGLTVKQYKTAPAMAIDPNKTYTADLQTNKGDIEVEFYPKDAPQTVNNFICLARDGYYDGTPFHRIVKGFVIQGGDPTGTGRGGPGYQFNDEPVKKDYEQGILAMANAGPNTNGSQFFIVLDNLQGKLPKNYTIFGKVTSGMDVVQQIANTPTKASAGGEQSAPTQPVTLEKVT